MPHIFLFISLSDVERYRKALIGDGIKEAHAVGVGFF